MPRRASTGRLAFLFGLAMGGIAGYWIGKYEAQTPVSEEPGRAYKVVRVIDGDTVELLIHGKKKKVRLIGADTPETVKPGAPVEPYGPEASAYTKLLLSGKSVYLEREPGEEIDRYGRELAYLYRSGDSLFVNLELIRQGYAKVYRKSDFKYRPLFEETEARALKEGKGLWASQQ